MRKILFVLALMAAPGAAQAAPTYLRCTLGDAAPLTITADESLSIVTVMVDGTPAPQRMTAAFAADIVTFGDRDISYQLDRRTLALTRVVRSMGWTDKGTCRIEKAEKRAF